MYSIQRKKELCELWGGPWEAYFGLAAVDKSGLLLSPMQALLRARTPEGRIRRRRNHNREGGNCYPQP
jgi:hypothetical protein